MGIVSAVLIWRDKGRLYSRITTNVDLDTLRARLARAGLLDFVEAIHAFFGDRANGGSGYELLWEKHVAWDDLRRTIFDL